MKFNEASKIFLEYVKVTRSAGTYDVYDGKLKVLNKYFEGVEIENITKFDIINFWSHRKEVYPEISPATLNKYRTVMILMIEYLTDKRLKVKKLRENKPLIEIIDEDILKKVLEHLKNQTHIIEGLRNYVLFKLLLDTGLRINEALHLKVNDIHFQTNTIHVKITKTKRERYVYFRDDTKEILKNLITRDQTNGYIFQSYKSKKKLSVEHVQNICYRLENTLKLPYNVRPHKWRHTFATKFLKSGGDLETLRLILGHESIRTTQRYLHLDNDFVRAEYFKNG